MLEMNAELPGWFVCPKVPVVDAYELIRFDVAELSVEGAEIFPGNADGLADRIRYPHFLDSPTSRRLALFAYAKPKFTPFAGLGAIRCKYWAGARDSDACPDQCQAQAIRLLLDWQRLGLPNRRVRKPGVPDREFSHPDQLSARVLLVQTKKEIFAPPRK